MKFFQSFPAILLVSLTLLFLATSGTGRAEEAVFEPDEQGFRRVVAPFFQQHCLRCHGPEKQEGEFRVDEQLPNDFLDLAANEHWTEVVNVLNSHEMPPEEEKQPDVDAVTDVVDWITNQMARAQLIRRDTTIVLRRLNRNEYRNTIRDLVGVDFDVSGIPQDPTAGGFDNNGHALTISPLLMELYYDTARKILDRALVTGQQPPTVKWRFEPDSGDSDSNRVTYDGQRAIVNGGKSRVENGFKVMHHDVWDRKLNARDFSLPDAGEYIIRIRAAGQIPPRAEVVEAARKHLTQRMEKQLVENPKGEKWHREGFERDLKHFETDRMYDYGPPRLKLVQDLGGQPRVLDEFDVDAPLEEPGVYELRARFTTEKAGLTIEYAYEVPSVLENFWFQTSDEFARPELWVDWFEIEGPIYDSWPPASHQSILFASPQAQTDERAYARQVIARFMRRAYRRPVSDAEVDTKLELLDAVRADAPSLVEAIKTPLSAILVSPFFLYISEPHEIGQAQLENAENESPAAFHEFTDASGRGLIARVIAVSGETVKIERKDGKVFSVPTARFSEVDQEFIAEFARRQNVKSPGRPLNDFELASRLSYFLWSSMPDDELFELAQAGALRDAKTLEAQVDRMLQDPKSSALTRDFAGQWLGLREVGANPPAKDLFPRYDRHLEKSIVAESEAFFAEILQQDLSVMNFVKADFVVINERLGRFYDIPGVRGDQFRRVDVPDGVSRGGVMTQASVLTITSNGTRTSPVKRGTWVLKNVLGTDPGLPVANAGDIAPKVPGIDKATVRKRLEIHRELPQCARCHSKIDPLGFALENFNAAGEWRLQEGFGYKGRIESNDPLIDASAKLPDGTQVNGVQELQAALLKQEGLFLQCLAGKVFTYALGRELGVADQLQVKAAVDHVKQEQYTLRSLLKFIVSSEPFRTK